MKILEAPAILNDSRILIFNKKNKLVLDELIEADFPSPLLPMPVQISVTTDENEFLSGRNGIVWATFNVRQADVIRNALLAQSIFSELKNMSVQNLVIFFIQVKLSDIVAAQNFIWKSESGLRLKPDWSYPKDAANKSFELWLIGH